MKWTYSIQQKITAALLLFIVVLVVLLNNISERRNNSQFEKTVNTIYDDRLVVEQFIFQLSIKLNKLMDVLDNPAIESSAKISITHQIQQEIKDINFLYAQTVLTKEESMRFNEFKNQIQALEQNLNRNKISEAKIIANNAVSQLHFLSEIQIKEAKVAFDQSKKILMSSKSSSQFEMALIIIIGLIIQVLIFASKSLNKPKENSDFNMN